MNRPTRSTFRRGFTLVETILAISITAMVGTGIATMMSVLGSDATMQFDLRSVLVRSSTAQARLSAYIAPARCVLETHRDRLVLWFDDARDSDSVHASELRWIRLDKNLDRVSVDFINFPDDWSQTAVAITDTEHASGSDWMSIRESFRSRGLLASVPLAEDVSHLAFETESGVDHESRLVEATLHMRTSTDPVEVRLTESIRMHTPPER